MEKIECMSRSCGRHTERCYGNKGGKGWKSINTNLVVTLMTFAKPLLFSSASRGLFPASGSVPTRYRLFQPLLVSGFSVISASFSAASESSEVASCLHSL